MKEVANSLQTQIIETNKRVDHVVQNLVDMNKTLIEIQKSR
ncbi:MAG: hypothetical protein QW680_10735 [Pyrobaculum sp.]